MSVRILNLTSNNNNNNNNKINNMLIKTTRMTIMTIGLRMKKRLADVMPLSNADNLHKNQLLQ